MGGVRSLEFSRFTKKNLNLGNTFKDLLSGLRYEQTGQSSPIFLTAEMRKSWKIQERKILKNR